jgi:hypothetical protein
MIKLVRFFCCDHDVVIDIGEGKPHASPKCPKCNKNMKRQESVENG